MGILEVMKNALSATNTELEDWNVLTDREQVQTILEASKSRPQLVYKHSHRCGTCLMAKQEIENDFDRISQHADMNFVNVVTSRPVSNALTEETDVRHESPQVLILKNVKAVWNESHHLVKADAILEALDKESR